MILGHLFGWLRPKSLESLVREDLFEARRDHYFAVATVERYKAEAAMLATRIARLERLQKGLPK